MNLELIFVLLAVAGLWGLFLLPSLFESRREAPLSSTQRYGSVSAKLNQMQAEQTVIAVSNDRLSSRRRRTLGIAGVLAIATLVVALTTGGLAWLVGHLVIDAFLAWYVAMLVQIRQQEQAIVRQQYAVPMAEVDRRVRVIAS